MSTQVSGYNYKTFASSSSDGSLVKSLSLSELESAVTGGQQDLSQYINQALQTAGNNLPEGTYVQLDVKNLPTTGYGTASYLASTINGQFRDGAIYDQSTGRPVQAWSDYPNQIAFQYGNTLTLRFVKEDFPVVLVIWAAIIIFISIDIWLALANSPWNSSIATPGGSGSPSSSSGLSIWTVIAGVGVIGLIGYGSWKIKLAEAGANKSNQEIYIGR